MILEFKLRSCLPPGPEGAGTNKPTDFSPGGVARKISGNFTGVGSSQAEPTK